MPDERRTAATFHQRACEIMAGASELPPPERERFVATECGGDGALAARVRELLRHHRDGEDLAPLGALFAAGGEAAAAGDAPADSAPPPVQVGPFRLLREIGRGSMGIVHEAEQELPRRRVALKLIRPGWRELVGWSRFERETAALGRLRHPGIATLYEAGVAELPSGPTPWFAMELVPGVPLDEFVRSPGVSRERRLRLFLQVCTAMEAAHAAGVVHRDLKPGNVLVEQGDRARVVDFGIAHLTDADAGTAARATTLGALLGTLAYMSPEQASGDSRAIDARSDVYSLGVMLHELLAGALPYETASLPVAVALRRIVEQEPAPLGQLDPSLKGDLENIVRKALEKEPAKRYASAGALGEDVARHLEHRPITAKAPTAVERAMKLARRHRAVVAGGAIAVVAIVAGFVALSIGLAQAREALGVSEQRRIAMLELVTDQLRAVRDLGEVSGAAPARRQMLANVGEFAAREGLEAGAGTRDPRMMEAFAGLLQVQGSLLVQDQQYDEARIVRDRTLALRRDLLAMEPQDPSRRRELSIAQVEVGDLEKQRGRYDEARGIYLDSLAIDEALVAEEPEERSYRSDLAYSYQRLGNLAECQRDFRAARAWYEKFLATVEVLLRESPEDRDARLAACRAHQCLVLVVGVTDSEKAREHGKAATKITRELMDRFPGDLEAAKSYVVAEIQRFIGLTVTGPLEVIVELPEVVAIAQRLRDENPDRRDLREIAIDARSLLLSIQRVCGDLDRAIPGLEQLAAESTADADTPGSTANSRSCAARLHSILQDVAMEQGRCDVALRHGREALRRYEALHRDDPGLGTVELARFCLTIKVPELRDPARGVALADDHFRRFPRDSRGWLEGIEAGYRASDDLATADAIREVLDRHPLPRE